MNAADLANKLGQTSMPALSRKILADTMTIVLISVTQDDIGGEVAAQSDAYTNVRCSAKPMTAGDREISAERLASIREYRVSFPTHTDDGDRINIDTQAHRLVVDARGNEPVKTFKILDIGNSAGVMFYAICEKED